MSKSDAQKRASAKYDAKTYFIITFKVRQDSRIKEMLTIAAQKRNMSASAYIIMAIEQLLSYDNITISALADLERQNEDNS